MTGNTVLLGLAIVQGHGADAARSAVAFGGFVIGVVLSTAIANARAAFTLQAAILAAVPVVGIWTGHLPLVAMSGSAMGMQAATGHHFMPPGLNLTFITGTTRAMVRRLTERALGREGEGPVGTPTAIWVAYFAGGLCGGAAAVAWRLPAFALPAAAVLATALRLPRPRPGQASHVR